MNYGRKALVGGQDPIPKQNLRQSLRSEDRAQHKSFEWLESSASQLEQASYVSSEQAAQFKMKMVEKYGRKLWENRDKTDFMTEVRKDLRLLLDTGPSLTNLQAEAETNRLLHELTGWGQLDHLLEDDDISEILIHRFDFVVVERKSTGRLEKLSYPLFQNEEQLLHTIEQIAATMGREFNETRAELHTQLPDGSRIAATHRIITPDGHSLTIRKHRNLLTEADYLALGSICEPILQFLKYSIGLSRASGLVSGGTGSGKTHLLNLLSQYISESLSVITIEDVLELRLAHPYVRRFLAKPMNHEGKGGFSIRDCVRLSLRKRPDIIIVGETRGGEIIDILWAMNTDHPGSWSTAHANSPRALIDSTLPILFGKADESYNSTERNLMIGSALDLIVQVKRFEEDGSRKVVAITEVVGTGESHEELIKRSCQIKHVVPSRVYLQDIYQYEATGVENGRVVGQYRWTGYKPERLVRKWLAKGLSAAQIDHVFFTQPISM